MISTTPSPSYKPRTLRWPFIIAQIFLLSHILMLVVYLQQLKPNSDSNAQIEKRSMHGSMASVAKARTPGPVVATTTAAATPSLLRYTVSGSVVEQMAPTSQQGFGDRTVTVTHVIPTTIYRTTPVVSTITYTTIQNVTTTYVVTTMP